MPTTPDHSTMSALLKEAVNKPGIISSAYNAFHNYSIGNQIAAICQCHARSIPIGPISTFRGWQSKGRCVSKGQKALQLCMPITLNRKDKATGAVMVKENGDPERFAMFVWKNNWFVLAQTEGADYSEAPPVPGWDKALALPVLKVTEEAYQSADGNCQGYSKPGRVIAINPLAVMPNKTRFHELAHAVMHSAEDCNDNDATPKSLREVEAESVALILCEILALPGAAESRGYIQNWMTGYGGQEIPEKSCQRIFKAADQILKAGQPQPIAA